MMAGCHNTPKDLSELKDATPADSMMYYFGEMQASYYWQDAQADTMLKTEASRRDFIEGFRAAMKMDRDENAYNLGLALGLRLAVRLREFKTRYGTEFSEEVLAASLEHFLENDTLVNVADAQRGYYRIKDKLELGAAESELVKAKARLAERGHARGYEMVSDTLFALDVTPATSARRFQEGDRISCHVTASTIDGKEIDARQFPDSITLGEGRVPMVVRYAIYTMTDGQTRQFMTTPRTLFGKRYTAFKLPPDEPVIFTVKAQY